MNVSRVSLIPKIAALDLWEFGEDAYIDRALELSDSELKFLGEKAYANFNKAYYEKGGRDLTASGYDIGFITALTFIEHFEGGVRPLKRNRRRSHTNLPKKLIITKQDYLGKTRSARLKEMLTGIVAKLVH